MKKVDKTKGRKTLDGGRGGTLCPNRKGERHGGRQRGGPYRKIPTIIREAALLACENVGRDGYGKDGLVGYFERIAIVEPVAMVGLLSKIIPYQVNATVKTDVEVRYRSSAEILEEMRVRGIEVRQLVECSPKLIEGKAVSVDPAE